ncbi:MAG: hypothetical protein QOE08_1370 [Thermoleophilaceae bacterium]|nr:hypothetical protein [Thermoleophilaceae bacterium]
MSFDSADAFERWLSEHHEQSDGIWLRFAKKGSGIASVTYAEALDSALCHGWIDGQAKAIDEQWYMQRFTPRRKRSIWSKRNVDKVAKLAEDGRMKPAGEREVERAKADGRWDAAYAGPRTANVPPDLQRELDARPGLAEFFNAMSSANRYSVIWNLETAKKPETRARRLEKYLAMMERGEKPHG